MLNGGRGRWGNGRVCRCPAGIPLELAWGDLVPALPAIHEADDVLSAAVMTQRRASVVTWPLECSLSGPAVAMAVVKPEGQPLITWPRGEA